MKLVLAGALVLLAGCAAQATRHDEDFAKAPPEVKADWDIAKQRCSACHSIERVFLNMHLYEDRGDLKLLVQDMAAKQGSGISNEDVPHIVNALDWHRTQP